MAGAVWRSAVVAARRVLEHAGVDCQPVPGDPCCGQPAYNAGARGPAAAVARRAARKLGVGRVVLPSASCAAMVAHGWPDLGVEYRGQAFELGDFLWHEVGVREWPAYPRPLAVVFHPACHTRGLVRPPEHERILGLVENVRLLPLGQPEQCCGFGGSFCASHPSIAAAIAEAKLDAAAAVAPDLLVSTDVGCLVHLEGVERRRGGPLRFAHFAEVLAACL